MHMPFFFIVHHNIIIVVSKYSQYGSGVITGSGLLELYKDAALSGLNADGSLKRAPSGNSNPLDNVWRDLEAHGIASPIQQAWDEEMEAIRAIHAVDTKQNDDSNGNDEDMLLDECEILEWKKDSATPDWTVDSQAAGENQRKMSHEMVDLCKDGITPKSLRDGEFSKFVSRQPTVQYIVVFYDGTSFRQSLTHCCTVFSTAVFIDEESCIGCNQVSQVNINYRSKITCMYACESIYSISGIMSRTQLISLCFITHSLPPTAHSVPTSRRPLSSCLTRVELGRLVNETRGMSTRPFRHVLSRA
jgi:hypothetical protein